VTGDLGPAAADRDVYARLIAELDASGCRYRLIEHAPEGRTEVVSALRGHVLASEDYLRLAGPRIARIIAT
jgi:Ala-tRNA(Pro) deacylase